MDHTMHYDRDVLECAHQLAQVSPLSTSDLLERVAAFKQQVKRLPASHTELAALQMMNVLNAPRKNEQERNKLLLITQEDLKRAFPELLFDASKLYRKKVAIDLLWDCEPPLQDELQRFGFEHLNIKPKGHLDPVYRLQKWCRENGVECEVDERFATMNVSRKSLTAKRDQQAV